MKRLFHKKWFRITAGLLLSLLILTLALAAYFDIWSREDLIAYGGMYYECHPVWKTLALRRIRAGHSVDDLTRLHQPYGTDTWKNYTFLDYESRPGEFSMGAFWVVAEDNKLVYAVAGNDTWQHEFFSTISEEERGSLFQRFFEYQEALMKAKKAAEQKLSPIAGPDAQDNETDKDVERCEKNSSKKANS